MNMKFIYFIFYVEQLNEQKKKRKNLLMVFFFIWNSQFELK